MTKKVIDEHDKGSNGTVEEDTVTGPPLLLQLILAQLLNEKGEDAFPEIVEDLKHHSLLQGIEERNMTVSVS